jgi:hypothetical protein
MPGRGDNNKHGSAGRGGSNQSNQGFPDADQSKSHHDNHKTGGKRSEPYPRSADPDANRNEHLATKEEFARNKESLEAGDQQAGQDCEPPTK